jgi:two-component system, sensor histidine kinase and response regulator
MRQSQRDRPQRILLIDPLPNRMESLDALLRSQGYEVTIAACGDTALRQIEQAAPDLILVDSGRSAMAGDDLYQQIYQHPALAVIPIVLLTANDDTAVQEVASGALDVMHWAIAPTDFLAKIAIILRLKQWFEQRYGLSQHREATIAEIIHDVRMPLTAAHQLLEEVQSGALGEISAEVRAALGQLAASHQRLLNLIELRLSIHQYEVGGIELNFFPVDLIELSEEVIETLQPLANQKGLDLCLVEGAGELPEVMGDRLELNRLLTNLIDNAIHFTDVGSVQVQITTSVDCDNNPWIAIAIADTGIGIAADEQAALFERFRQGNHRRPGHGLGLYLCRQIAEAHRGRIEVRSTLGQGSCFTVYLPASITK